MEIHKVSQARMRGVESPSSATQSLSENEKIQQWTELLKEMPDIREESCLKETPDLKKLAGRMLEEFITSQS